jgi:hypothetical protein
MPKRKPPEFYVGNPLRAEPEELDFAARRAWNDILAASETRHRMLDYHAPFIEITARFLASWRRGQCTREHLRPLVRALGDVGVPERERRRLLFPDRIGPDRE